jgi:hypothetical protein
MKNETPDHIDRMLNNVEQVEISPFMLTRIHAVLEAEHQEQIPKNWVWAVSSIFVLLFVLNIWAIQQYQAGESDASTLIEQMNLNPDNSFYK